MHLEAWSVRIQIFQRDRISGHNAISGIELAEQIQKGQFKTGNFGNRKATMSELWNAALAA
jgi:hypothetical protein